MKKADEQAKAQNLFARWRKEETLYKEDEKNLVSLTTLKHHQMKKKLDLFNQVLKVNRMCM